MGILLCVSCMQHSEGLGAMLKLWKASIKSLLSLTYYKDLVCVCMCGVCVWSVLMQQA